MDDRHRDAELAKRLLAEDRPAEDPAGAADGHALLERLLDREEAAERRVRWVAVRAWVAVLAAVPLTGLSVLIRRVDDGVSRDVVRAGLVVIGLFAAVALLIALLTTVGWLFRFRPRSASLAIIERRLAALEELLRRGR